MRSDRSRSVKAQQFLKTLNVTVVRRLQEKTDDFGGACRVPGGDFSSTWVEKFKQEVSSPPDIQSGDWSEFIAAVILETMVNTKASGVPTPNVPTPTGSFEDQAKRQRDYKEDVCPINEAISEGERILEDFPASSPRVPPRQRNLPRDSSSTLMAQGPLRRRDLQSKNSKRDQSKLFEKNRMNREA